MPHSQETIKSIGNAVRTMVQIEAAALVGWGDPLLSRALSQAAPWQAKSPAAPTRTLAFGSQAAQPSDASVPVSALLTKRQALPLPAPLLDAAGRLNWLDKNGLHVSRPARTAACTELGSVRV